MKLKKFLKKKSIPKSTKVYGIIIRNIIASLGRDPDIFYSKEFKTKMYSPQL